MILNKATMKTAVGLVAALAWAQAFAVAQTTYSVADCSELETLSPFAEDAVVDFAASPVSWYENLLLILDWSIPVLFLSTVNII